jgi:hypothetical protein
VPDDPTRPWQKQALGQSPIVPAVEREPERVLDPFVLSLLRAAGRPSREETAEAAPRLAKVLPRRVLQPEHVPVSKLALALDVIGAASADQLRQIDEALAARRAT